MAEMKTEESSITGLQLETYDAHWQRMCALHVHFLNNYVMGCSTSVQKKRSSKATNCKSTAARIRNSVVKISPAKTCCSLHAAILIQTWYRRYVARLEIRRRCTWNIFQSIEYAGEQDQLKLHNFFNIMLKNMSNNEKGQAPLITAFNVNKRSSIYDSVSYEDRNSHDSLKGFGDDIEVESSYKGPHLTFPLTLNQLHRMVQAFRRKLSLHAKYTIQLLLEVRRILKTQSNIRYASTSISNQFTICGDIHGKLTDLYLIFHKNGLPSVTNPYIFNGDFVDRGAFSAEVAIVLFSCFVMNPNEVFLNRGNHEDHVMNARYGFMKELHKKYRKHSKPVIKLFADVFSWLPLATVIDDKIMVCHGGISDTTDLEMLAKIDRHKFASILQPPGRIEDLTAVSQADLMDWKQMLDIVWSDPKNTLGCSPNEFRGGGCYFGPDTLTKFLKKNNFKMLIRSHECKPEGYEYMHGGKVLTVFSASNYYETGSNKGAYVKISAPDFECHIVQYMSSNSPVHRKITFTQRVNVVEQTAMDGLKDKVLASRTELIEAFQKHDTQNTGKISTCGWCSCMELVLEMDLPWRTLKSKLVGMYTDDYVWYDTTFGERQVRHRYSGNGPSITETLYRHKESLGSMFRLIDSDHSGCISMQEFEDALTLLIKQMDLSIKPSDIKDIAQSLDINKDGQIDFNEFLEAFRIVDNIGADKSQHKNAVTLDQSTIEESGLEDAEASYDRFSGLEGPSEI